MAGVSPRLEIVRDTLRYLSPRLVVRDTRGRGSLWIQAGDIRFYTRAIPESQAGS